MKFSKYSGCGNDFILIDNRTSHFQASQQQRAQLCHRRYGIGADGLILLEKGLSADFRMRIFNADGGETEMCGNGARCCFRFLQGLTQVERCTLETLHGKLSLSQRGPLVAVEMGTVSAVSLLVVRIHDQDYCGYFLNTGVPHFVAFVDNLQLPSFTEIARSIRHHPLFGPPGTNVNFVDAHQRTFRTFERGVEEETLACGTGAVAVAIALALKTGATPPFALKTSSNQYLHVHFQEHNGSFEQVALSGPVDFIFEGNLSFDILQPTACN